MDEKENIYKAPEAELVDNNNSATEGKELASRLLRLGAAILDSLIVGIPFVILIYLTGFWSSLLDNPDSYSVQIGIFLTGMAVWLAFNGYLLKTSGQTIGKKMVNIKIVSIDNNEVPSIMTTAGTRYFLVQLIAMVPLIGSIFSLVDILFIFRQDRRCVHDLMAKTRVVEC
ncbi:MAG: RDD family protein [Porticoccaceae bacterium]|nr:RDD family protein [Porticoccaceae bacterium]